MKSYLGKDALIPVMPVAIIATECDGKLNFAPHGQIGTISAPPSVVYTSVIKAHLTAQNIIKTNKFSVNIPNSALIEKLTLCGSKSGNEHDKSNVFGVFRRETGFPMIEDCPICFVCELIKTVEIGEFCVFFGEVKECYADEGLVSADGLSDIDKTNALLCSVDGSFRTAGKSIMNMNDK